MNEYEKQAEDFLKKMQTTFKATFIKNGFNFVDDKETRDIYEIELKRGERVYTFNFGNSINASGKYTLFLNNGQGKRIYNDLKEVRKDCLKINKHQLSKGNYRENENFKEPSAYSVLSCLTKDDEGSFKDFCSSYGYDEDSRKAEKIYNAVKKEYENLLMLFNEDEMNELREIQ